MSRRVAFRSKVACSCCGSSQLDEVIALPNLPHIGIFQASPENLLFPEIDQALMMCNACSHLQLKNLVDPEFLYDESFTHRTSASPSAMASSSAFARFITTVGAGRRFCRTVEIGCNDAFLLTQLLAVSDTAVGIDPVLRGHEHEFLADQDEAVRARIRCIGDFIENVDIDTELGGKPDLIVSAFVFEHLANPRETLGTLLDIAADDALFVIKVPGTDMLLDNCRFDQLSHQHYQQWTLQTFKDTITRAGGHYLAHHVYNDVWGAIMIAFQKQPGGIVEPAFRRTTRDHVLQRKKIFDGYLNLTRQVLLGSLPRKIFGFGAAQNFPVLAYFFEDVSFLECILDDNPARQGRYYPGLAVPILAPVPEMHIEQHSVLITGPDYGRALVRRASAFNPQQIVLPFAAI